MWTGVFVSISNHQTVAAAVLYRAEKRWANGGGRMEREKNVFKIIIWKTNHTIILYGVGFENLANVFTAAGARQCGATGGNGGQRNDDDGDNCWWQRRRWRRRQHPAQWSQKENLFCNSFVVGHCNLSVCVCVVHASVGGSYLTPPSLPPPSPF